VILLRALSFSTTTQVGNSGIFVDGSSTLGTILVSKTSTERNEEESSEKKNVLEVLKKGGESQMVIRACM
jgi:hypothetical protein